MFVKKYNLFKLRILTYNKLDSRLTISRSFLIHYILQLKTQKKSCVSVRRIKKKYLPSGETIAAVDKNCIVKCKNVCILTCPLSRVIAHPLMSSFIRITRL